MKKRWPNRLLALVLLAGLLACAGDPPPTGATPAAPTNVTVSAGAGFVDVAWEHDGANATGFVIYREAGATSTAAVRPAALTELAEVAASARSYRDQQVAVGTSYRYAVAAKGAGGRQSAPAAQTTAPLEPDPADTSIADYVVPPGVVATVTRVEGTIEEYDGGAVDATFASFSGSSSACPEDDPDCLTTFQPGKPWIPTTIDADGQFTIDLPGSIEIGDGARLNVCGAADPVASVGALYVHDAPFGEPGPSPTAAFGRYRIEDPKTPVGWLADASVLVMYWYLESDVDVACVQEVEDPDGWIFDVDLKLRDGWNVVYHLQRSEDDDMLLYARSGEPGLTVPWVEPEPLY